MGRFYTTISYSERDSESIEESPERWQCNKDLTSLLKTPTMLYCNVQALLFTHYIHRGIGNAVVRLIWFKGSTISYNSRDLKYF